MKAIAITRYGGPDELSEMELPDPPVGPDTVLVRVRAAGVNPVDWKIREGYLAGAFPSHFPLVPGWDLAGVVEAAGPAVTGFAVGDEVIGYARRDEIQHGTYAELVPAPERALAPKPASASWAEAGALPLAGLTAYQSLRAAGVGDGDTVLVHAAAGGVGHLAVQLARILGARRVIGTASAGNHSYVRSLGGEPVIYGEGLLERVQELAPDGIDAVVDFVGGDALTASAALLGRPKRLVSIVDAETVLRLGGTYVFVKPSTADLTTLSELVDAGRLAVHIDRTFPLAQAADAQRLVQEGHVRGKVVLEV
ncbi:NADPH:quinone reductase [Micromonospora pattaloongensis]|uniref:NADPH:quinone reductase n=1 Tax=Micromonospora pattaloongensis TaxID=405436 RepID=A0A1H3SRV2_9ACTN|nr:NADP-dependent oxidoreductase [Micromonospora pattaloongensis]SDZ40427.1 NADPH:quinone reductase [Micromonospora pattaloongensis]